MSNICTTTNCTRKIYGHKMCEKHYDQVRAHGKTYISKYDPRPHVANGDVALIPLGAEARQGYAIVDIADAWVDKYKWTVANGYPCTSINNKTARLPRVILEPKEGFHVNHINHDKLDNRRSNLRICLQGENNWNKSIRKNNRTGYKGVVLSPAKTYISQIKFKGKVTYLGRHQKATDAARAYNEAAKKLYGEFAYLNTINGDN